MSLELGERVAKSKAFRPMDGMLLIHAWKPGKTWRLNGDHSGVWDSYMQSDWVVDVEDPATQGCLHHLLYVERHKNPHPIPTHLHYAFPGELVAALEAYNA